MESSTRVSKITSKSENSEILVPLTSCMYVPGRIKNANKFLLNMGTGYYIEKDGNGAAKFFERKVKHVTEQIEKVQGFASEKTKLNEIVMDMMQVKIDEQLTAMGKVQPA